jgi:hypothetical protein
MSQIPVAVGVVRRNAKAHIKSIDLSRLRAERQARHEAATVRNNWIRRHRFLAWLFRYKPAIPATVELDPWAESWSFMYGKQYLACQDVLEAVEHLNDGDIIHLSKEELTQVM